MNTAVVFVPVLFMGISRDIQGDRLSSADSARTRAALASPIFFRYARSALISFSVCSLISTPFSYSLREMAFLPSRADNMPVFSGAYVSRIFSASSAFAALFSKALLAEAVSMWRKISSSSVSASICILPVLCSSSRICLRFFFSAQIWIFSVCRTAISYHLLPASSQGSDQFPDHGLHCFFHTFPVSFSQRLPLQNAFRCRSLSFFPAPGGIFLSGLLKEGGGIFAGLFFERDALRSGILYDLLRLFVSLGNCCGSLFLRPADRVHCLLRHPALSFPRSEDIPVFRLFSRIQQILRTFKIYSKYKMLYIIINDSFQNVQILLDIHCVF